MSDEQDDTTGPAEVTDPTKLMEGYLRRAQLLQGSINAFEREMTQSRGLPSVQAMQSRLGAIQSTVHEFVSELNVPRNRELLSRTVVLPNYRFPKQQAHILENILRTKMEPHVEDWEAQNLKAAAEKDNKQAREKMNGPLTTLLDKDRERLWRWAPRAANQEGQKYPWFDADYTLAEKDAGIENVVHGLRRQMKVPESPGEDDEFEEDDDEFEDVDETGEQPDAAGDAGQPDAMDVDTASLQPDVAGAPILPGPSKTRRQPMAMDQIHRFMTKGEAA